MKRSSPPDASRACVEREDRVELGGDDDQVAVGVVGELDAGRVQGLRAPRVVSGRGRAPGRLPPRMQPGRTRASATSTPSSRTRRGRARAHLGIDRAVHGPLVLQLQAGHGARRQLGVHHKACALAGGASGQRAAALDPLRSGGGGAHSGAWARSGWCRRPPVQTNGPVYSPAAARKAGVCEPAASAHTCGSKHLRKHGLEIWQPASLVIACVIQEQPAGRGSQSAICHRRQRAVRMRCGRAVEGRHGAGRVQGAADQAACVPADVVGRDLAGERDRAEAELPRVVRGHQARRQRQQERPAQHARALSRHV